MIKKNPAIGMAMAAATMALAGGLYRPPEEIVPKKKVCLNCPTEHDHNNSFCSAKCCKEYTEQEKQARKKLK